MAVWGWTHDFRSILVTLCHSARDGWEGEGAVGTAMMDLPALEEPMFPLLFTVLTDEQLQGSRVLASAAKI